MIIRGGINIYPREIEEILITHPKIMEAAVIGLPDEIWGERVHACVILREGQKGWAEEIQAFCGERLADFKVPASISFHSDFPRTGPTKIQKPLLVELITEGKI